MHPLRPPLIHRWLRRERVSYGNETERHYTGGDTQYFRRCFHAVIVRIKARPHSPEPKCMCGKKNIFRRGREVLHPKRRVVAIEKSLLVATHHYHKRRVSGHLCIRQRRRKTPPQRGIVHRYKFPRLPVDTRWRTHCRMEQRIGFLSRNSLGGKSSHACARDYIFKSGINCFHLIIFK